MNAVSKFASERALRLSRNVVLAGLIIVVGVASLLPVYSDELGWRFQERAWIDGVDKMYNDLCGPNTLARPPWFMMPVRWFSAVTNQALADPFYVRIEGVLCAFVWIALLFALTVRLEADPAKRLRSQMLAFALLGLGTLPFLLVLSRPEQPLMLTVTMMILMGLHRSASVLGSSLKAIAFVVLGTVAASYHMKGVAYAPIMFVCLGLCARGRGTVAPRLVAGLALAATMTGAAVYWAGRFQCTGDAIMAKDVDFH